MFSVVNVCYPSAMKTDKNAPIYELSCACAVRWKNVALENVAFVVVVRSDCVGPFNIHKGLVFFKLWGWGGGKKGRHKKYDFLGEL